MSSKTYKTLLYQKRVAIIRKHTFYPRNYRDRLVPHEGSSENFTYPSICYIQVPKDHNPILIITSKKQKSILEFNFLFAYTITNKQAKGDKRTDIN